MQRILENGTGSAAGEGSSGLGVLLQSPRHQTKSQENGVGDAVGATDGEMDECTTNAAGEDNVASQHQLELRPQASWTFSSAPPKVDLRKSSQSLSTSHEGQVFMDEAKKFILFYAESAVTIKDLENNTQETYQLGLPDGERLFWAEVSADLKHLLVRAMSRPQWIRIYSLEGGKAQERFLVQGGKRVGSIERVHWTEPGNLFIVSPGGIEFYQIPNRDSLSLMEKWTLRDTDLRLLKEFKMPLQFSKYYASTRVLLVYTGVKGGKAKLEGFFFKQDFVMKLPKLEIDMVADSVLTADNISMCRLYERLFCAHIEETQITLYQITKTSVSKKATIMLEGRPLPHRLRIHCVDNLLALHNTDAKTTTLYDIRYAQFSADDAIVQPIAEGLSITPFSYEDKPVSLYQKRWQYLQPNYVLDQDEEKLFEVGLVLPHLVDCFADKERLVQFLLRRTHSRTLTLEIVRNALQQRVPLPVVSRIFDSINVVFDVPPTPTEKSSNRAVASSLPITRTMTVSPAGKALPPVSVIPSGSSLMQNGSAASSPISYRSDARFEVSSFASSSPSSFAPDSPSTFWSPITTTTSVYSSPYSSSSFSSISPSFTSASATAASQSPFPLADTSVLASPFSAWDIMIEEEKRARGGQLMLDQNDLYNHVFVPLDDNKLVGSDFFIPVLTEYVRSLSFYKQNVEHFICKLIIEHLITSNRYYQLHQFLQYHVIGDSVHVACQLLSVEKNYPPAYQLALDMLKRLSATRKGVKDQIVEVLLTRHQLLPALRLIRNAELAVTAERFLEVALEQDENLFYTVYKFFEKRGEINRECAPFIQTFCKMFPGPDSARWESTAGLEAYHYSGPGSGVSSSTSASESDDSAPSSSVSSSASSLTTFADLSSSPYASPAPSSPFSTPVVQPKRRANVSGRKPAARSALAL